MRYTTSLSSLFIALFFLACHQLPSDRYYQIIDQAETIQIDYLQANRTVVLDSTQLLLFKTILKEGIHTESPKEMHADIVVTLQDHRTSFARYELAYNEELAFVNFYSDDSNFGFPLTYGIGRYLDEISAQQIE